MTNSVRTDRQVPLSVHAVTLDVPATSRWEALDHVGNSFEMTGAAHAGYRESLQEKERNASTYLGHGVAVPHALHLDDYLVTNPGLSLTRFAKPVPWGDEMVSLCIGFAAPSDEHIEIICRISLLVTHPTHLDMLMKLTDHDEILHILQQV